MPPLNSKMVSNLIRTILSDPSQTPPSLSSNPILKGDEFFIFFHCCPTKNTEFKLDFWPINKKQA